MILLSGQMNRQRNQKQNASLKKANNFQKVSRVYSERKRFETDYSNMGSPRSDQQIRQLKRLKQKEQDEDQREDEYCRQYCSEQIDITRVRQLYKMFKSCCLRNREFLDLTEFQKLIENCGYQMNITTCRGLFKQLKQINKPGISFEDIVQLIKIPDYSVDTQKDLKTAFQVYDKKKIGKFTLQDYMIVSGTIKQKFDQEQIRRSFELMDTNNDGFVDYEEFKMAMRL